MSNKENVSHIYKYHKDDQRGLNIVIKVNMGISFLNFVFLFQPISQMGWGKKQGYNWEKGNAKTYFVGKSSGW